MFPVRKHTADLSGVGVDANIFIAVRDQILNLQLFIQVIAKPKWHTYKKMVE